ncbi:MAG TPA: hypothetical protein ENF18_05195 [candidate division WOR-3 bacterium]|uniref:Polysaccharide chain length determinant N-terminal domain-containing protein n=1 Tax=candidate division WOR-3 bacterium TaxID=2052148 RepID=A0A7C0VAN1_UNCW3|nr:hypothetical protein [candidate division WOR-3 bacterium]
MRDVDLLDILKTLRRNFWLLFFSFFGPAMIAMGVSLLLPKAYTSYVRVLAPEVEAGGTISSSPFSAISGLKLGKTQISTQAIMALLKSDRMFYSIARHFNLKEKLHKKQVGEAVKYLRKKMVSIDLDEDNGIIEIAVTTYWPELSRDMALYFVENLNKINEEMKLCVKKDVVKILDYPGVPRRKSRPKIKLNMAMAGFIGLILGVFYIYIKEKTANAS